MSKSAVLKKPSKRFRIVLALVQTAGAAVFGGIGIWQRYRILSQPFLDGQTLWDTTAAFHVWPWPLKVAFIMNLPALLAAAVISLPMALVSPWAPKTAMTVVDGGICLTVVFTLWYWIGARIEQSICSVLLLSLFAALSVVGALFVPGYTSFVPYGVVLWIVAVVAFARQRRHPPTGLPVTSASSH